MLSLAADDFLSLADSKLRWIDARTRVLAGNIANADTPGYVAHDLSPFPDTLSSFDIAMTRTDPADLGGVDEQSPVIAAGESERSIDGNGISLDQQMRLVAENAAANAAGYVKLPNVNSFVEMMDMREAERSYSADLDMMQVTRSMMARTLDLLK